MFQILREGFGVIPLLFSHLFVFSSLVIPLNLVFTVTEEWGGVPSSKNNSFNYHLLCFHPFSQLSRGHLIQDLSKLLKYEVSTEESFCPSVSNSSFPITIYSISSSSYETGTKSWYFSPGPVVANFHPLYLPFWPLKVSSPAHTN